MINLLPDKGVINKSIFWMKKLKKSKISSKKIWKNIQLGRWWRSGLIKIPINKLHSKMRLRSWMLIPKLNLKNMLSGFIILMLNLEQGTTQIQDNLKRCTLILRPTDILQMLKWQAIKSQIMISWTSIYQFQFLILQWIGLSSLDISIMSISSIRSMVSSTTTIFAIATRTRASKSKMISIETPKISWSVNVLVSTKINS